MNRIVIIILFFSINSAVFTQDDQPCLVEVSSSVKKLFDKGKNYKKYDYRHRVKYFKDALEIDEECLPCIWELGKMSFRRRYANGENLDFPKRYFLKLEQLCPSYHVDVYYYLSLIYYTEKEDCSAVTYFQKFLDFPTDNSKKLSINYKDQRASVEQSLVMSQFYCDFYSNPVPFTPHLLKEISKADKNEVLPTISPDNEQIYYTREYQPQIKGDLVSKVVQEFTVSERENVSSPFEKGLVLGSPFNEGAKYGGATLSINNKELYICACMPNGGYFNCDIFKSTYQIIDKSTKFDTIEFKWTALENLGPNINGLQSWEAQPSLSADGKILYFASARPGGYGKIDIYYSERQENGKWGPAKNIGTPINTAESDKSPFIHPDGRTLYFVSESNDNRWGAGDFDIFFTKKNINNSKWSEPENIGYPVNSEGAEEALIVSTDGRFGYFSSQRDGGAGGKDIYYFNIPEKAKPDKVLLIKGTSNTVDQQQKDKTKLVVRDSTGKAIEQAISIEDDGNFIAIANVEDIKGDVLLELQTEGAAFESIYVKEGEVESSFIENIEIEINPIVSGASYTIDDILFETNSSKIIESSKLVINGFANWLKDNKSVNVEIQGHTDDVGADEANMALSMDRAFSVMEFLLELSINPERLSFKGYGETSPKFSNDNSDNRSKNRRTDFLIF
jgi:outer membrane protein OmpA-like peptidoglycan-associated protein